MSTTYSFKDLSGAFIHPLVGSYPIGGGNVGLGQIVVSMTIDRTVQDMSADGSCMVSYIAGDNGSVSIEVQQTSDLHTFLLGWFNACKTAADAGSVALWAQAAFSVRNILDGSSHAMTGVSPGKVPDKTYASQGGKITWILPCAKIINE
jgi:Protein of unknown function (DUF3277)